MLQNLFAWLRSSVRDAVLGGVADALEVIDAGPRDATAAPLDALRARLAPALTNATPASIPANVSGVPQDEPADETPQSPTAHRNGRQKKSTAPA